MRRRLLAGSFGPERIPVRPDPGVADWYQPLHVRDAGAARTRLSSQVAAGADVIVAPSWLTHRRALLPVGETRRARAWTAAAVRVAREAVEMGLEARLEATAAQDAEDAASAPVRPRPLVAATLPALDAAADTGSGRLLPPEAASERDHHDQAGLLADAEPDLLLVEGQATAEALRHALDAVGATGMPAWLALHPRLDAGSGVEAALDLARDAAVSVILLSTPAGQDGAATTLRASALGGPRADSGPAWGSWLTHPAEGAPEVVRRWLEEGARAIAVLDGATPAALAPLRDAIDAHERAEVEATQRAAERWWQLVRRAAAMAPGGRAVWIASEPRDAGDARSPEPTHHVLPGGFEWLVIHPDDAGHLPDERIRLLVDGTHELGAMGRAARLLERGGCAALRGSTVGQRHPELRVVVLDEQDDPVMAILRKEG